MKNTLRSSFTLIVALTLPLVGDLRADAPASLSIRYNGTDFEGFQAFELEWNAVSNATYGVQVSTNLEAGSWDTIDLVTPTGNLGSYKIPPANQGLLLNLHLYSRLVLPQPRIFTVEPAIFASDAAVDAFVIGQCFESNDVVRVDGVTVSGVIFVNHNLLQVPLPSLSVGPHLVELVRGGVVISSFTISNSGTQPSGSLFVSALQGPPKMALASPLAYYSRNTVEGNLNTPNCRTLRLPLPPTQVRVDSWASVFEMTTGGGGVSPFSGEVQLGEADLVIPGRGLDFIWARTYNSRIGRTGSSINGWTFSYDVSVAPQSDGTIQLRSGNGRTDTFYPNGTNGWTRPEYFGEFQDLDGNGGLDRIVFYFSENSQWLFNPLTSSPAPGKLWKIIDRNGNTNTLNYDVAGRLATIVDDLDRTNTVAYNVAGQLSSVTDFSGRTVRYEYDVHGDLVACVSPPVIGTPNGNDFPGGKTNRYTYTSGFPFALNRQNHLLLSCVDALGQTTAQFTYDLSLASSPSYLRCVAMQEWTNPPTRFSYLPQTPTPANQFATRRCVVNDPVGNVAAISTDARGRCVKLEEFTGRATPGTTVMNTASLPIPKLRLDDPASYETRWSWNNDSLCTLETLPGGQKLQRIYESDFDKSTRARKRADCRVVREIASEPVDSDGDFVPDATERTWHYNYEPGFGSDPTPDRAAFHAINTKGIPGGSSKPKGMAAAKGIISSKPGTAVPKGMVIHNGANWGKVDNTDSVTDGSANKVNQTSGEQCDPGGIGESFVTSATDPRGIVTTVEYDAHGQATRWERGDVALVSDTTGGGLDLVYNPHGQVTAITNAADANGFRRVDTFSYYTNGPQAGYLYDWKLDVSTPDTTITTGPCEYDLRGNLTRFVNPRGHDTLYTYNALNQLVRYQTPTNLTARCTTDFTYDANNNLVESATELRDENDAFVRLIVTTGNFDVLARPVSVVNQVSASQFVTNKFFYDANDNVVAVHSPLAVSGADPHAITQIAYDERDLLFLTTAAPGSTIQSTTQCDYDANGNLTRVSEGLEGTPSITTMEYDGFAGFPGPAAPPMPNVPMPSFAHFRLPFPNDARVNADATVNLAQIQGEGGPPSAPFDGTVECCDSSLRLAKTTDPLGNVTTFNFDANNNLKVARHFGQLNDTPGTNGNIRLAESRWKYDGLDRRIEARAAFYNPATQAPIGDGASVTTFAYAPNGQCTNVTDDLGRATTLAYDTVGRHISTTSAGAKTVTAVFRDAAGNVTRSTQTDISDLGGPPQVFTRTNVFDSLNRLNSTVDNVGNTNRYAYDSASRVVRATDPKGNVRWARYDDLSRQTLALFDLNSDSIPDVVVAGAYDANSRLISTTDANTNTTSYAYDSRNRQILTTSPDGTAHSLVWNTSSDLVRQQDPNGTVITNSYDLLGRCVRRDITPGAGVATTTTFETFAYNGRSQLVAATNDVSHSEFDYDSMGNCFGNHNDGWNVLSTYDSVGNRVSMTYPSGRIVTYAYDALNQVTNLSSSASAMTAPTTVASFAYEGPGRDGRIMRANGVNTRILWNGLVSPPNAAGDFGRGQVSSINHQIAGGGAVIDRRVTAYDRNQNKTLRAQTAPFAVGQPMLTNMWGHDALNRVAYAWTVKPTMIEDVYEFTLDGNGNRQVVTSNGIAQSYVMDATIPPADFQMDQYTMTPFGFESHDENGNRIAKNSTVAQLQYQYDFANRLVAVNDVFTGVPEPVASYSYNALGQRISKTTYPPAPALPVTIEHIHDTSIGEKCDDGGDIIEERVAGVLSDIFVHVSGLKEEIRENDNVFRSAPPLVRFSPAGAATYLHADDLGNVLALTDDLGGVVERTEYADFGLPIFLTSNGTPIATNASPVGNRFLFGGREWDSETGLYFTWTFPESYPVRWEGPELDDSLTASANGIQRFRDDPYAEDARRGSARWCDPQTGRGFNGNNPWSGGGQSINVVIVNSVGTSTAVSGGR